MAIRDLIVVGLVAFFLKIVLVRTPSGWRIDFSRLPRSLTEAISRSEKSLQPLIGFAGKKGVKVPRRFIEIFEASRAKREKEIADRNADGWSAVGVDEEEEISAFVEVWGPHPEGPRKLADWRAALGQACSNTEANEWRSLSPDLARWVTWKVEGLSPADARAWSISKSVTPVEAREWKECGFTPEVAASWRNAGYAPKEAFPSSFNGVLNVIDAKRLTENLLGAGISREGFDVKPWIAAGFTDSQLPTVPSWIQSGFTATEAQEWGNDPIKSADWKNLGFTPEEMRAWRVVNSAMTPEFASQWTLAGFAPGDYARWSGMDPELAAEWREAGFDSESDSREWWNRGFIASDAKSWQSIRGLTPEAALAWQQYGFVPNEAVSWINCGMSAQRSRLWIGAGFAKASVVVRVDQLAGDLDGLEGVFSKLRNGKSLADVENALDSSPGNIGLSPA